MNNYKIIFVHGYTASSKADWYPNIRPLLDRHKLDYIIPDLPNSSNPTSLEWVETINEEVKKTNKPTILVGHSLGTRAVLLYLEKHRTKVHKVFLIAPLSNDLKNGKRKNESYPDFFDHKIDIDSIKKLTNNYVVIHSKDDSSIDYTQAEEITQDLDAKLITFVDRDHFSDPSNAPIIYNILKEELSFI